MPSTKKANNQAKKPRARQMKPEERKKLLLETAVSVFAEKGLSSAKHADIAAVCGVAVPTVFSYFPTREALTQAVLNEVASFIRRGMQLPVGDDNESFERLYNNAMNMAELSKQHPDYMKVWIMWTVHFAPEIQAQFREFEKEILDQLSELIRAGSSVDDPDEAIHDKARIIIGANIFLLKMIFDGAAEERQQSYIRHIISFVLAESA
jgi:TetR/AcrR family transcriptional regulator, hemagglutinin/protease regulatory protein